MRFGLPVSLVTHAAVIAVGLFALGSAESYEPEDIQSIAVDLIPLSDFTNSAFSGSPATFTFSSGSVS